MQGLLTQVHEGMPVYDRDRERLGTVRDVHMGREPAASTAARPAVEPHSFLDDILRTLAPPGPPSVVRERLLEEGFVRIDTGLFGGDRYAFGSQVRAVTDAGVFLDVSRDELLRR